MAKAWRMSSWLALALLVALLAVAAAEEAASAPEAADVPAAAAVAELEAADDDEDAAPAPAPGPASEERHEKPWVMHHMMEQLSAGTAKLECKILGKCKDAPPQS